MTAHDHSEVVNGCFRCELGRDELGVSGPQLDIDAIEARAEGAIDGPWELHEMAKDESYGYWPIGYVTDHPNAGLVCEVPDYGYWTAVFIAAARTDVPVLCAEVRQLREQLAWEKSINDGLALQQEGWEEWSNTLASLLPESYDDDAAQEAIIERFVRDSVAALGAAGSQGQSGENPKDTPTPQETPKWNAETGMCSDYCCPDFRLGLNHYHSAPHRCTCPSTPEAATERLLVPIEAIWACIDAGHDVGQRHRGGHLDTATCHDCRTPYDRYWSPVAPSGLQRATEQRCKVTGDVIGTECEVGGFSAHTHYLAAVGGSDTPADRRQR